MTLASTVSSARSLEQQRQILVPYLPQREPHSDGVLPIAEHRRLVKLKPVRHTRSAMLTNHSLPTGPSAARPAGRARAARRGDGSHGARAGAVLSGAASIPAAQATRVGTVRD